MQTTAKTTPKKSISKFLKRYHSIKTIGTYRSALVAYMNYLYDVEETRREAGGRAPDQEYYDRLALDYLSEPRDYGSDLTEFLASMGDAPPQTKQCWKSAAVSWLASNKIYLHPEETRRIRTGCRPRTRDRAPTQEEIRQIMDHCDLQMKTYLLMLSSAGLRPGEGVKLWWSDIDAERGLIFVRAEIAKNKESRVCFMSTEAMEAYQQWIQFYPQFLEKKEAIGPRSGAKTDPERIFPLTYSAVQDKFARALTKAGLDERDPSTRRFVLHLHTMRKFFRTRLPMGGATVDVTEALMGHTGYLAGSYLRLTDEDLEAAYRAAEHELWIYKTRPINEAELQTVKDEAADLREKLTQMRHQVATMQATQTEYIADAATIAKRLAPEDLDAIVAEAVKRIQDGGGA
jgi:integrase